MAMIAILLNIECLTLPRPRTVLCSGARFHNIYGGPMGIRTPDPCIANAVLYR